jgi:hypothetical protein
MSSVRTLLLAIAFGDAGAVAVVAFHSVAADAVGGAVAICALVVVISSTIRLAGDAGEPDEPPPSASPPSQPKFRPSSSP